MKKVLLVFAVLFMSASAQAVDFSGCQNVLPYVDNPAGIGLFPFGFTRDGTFKVDMKSPAVVSFEDKDGVQTLVYSYGTLGMGAGKYSYKNKVVVQLNSDGSPQSVDQITDPNMQKQMKKWSKAAGGNPLSVADTPEVSDYKTDFEYADGKCSVSEISGKEVKNPNSTLVYYERDLCKKLAPSMSKFSMECTQALSEMSSIQMQVSQHLKKKGKKLATAYGFGFTSNTQNPYWDVLSAVMNCKMYSSEKGGGWGYGMPFGIGGGSIGGIVPEGGYGSVGGLKSNPAGQ